MRDLTIDLVTEGKAHCLAAFLDYLANQTWPKSKTHIFITTDSLTHEIVHNWLNTPSPSGEKWSDEYTGIVISNRDKPLHSLPSYGVLRQDAVNYAYRQRTHYMSIRCDHMLTDETLIWRMIDSKLPVVAPLTTNGLKEQSEQPFIEVDEIGETYLVRYEYLTKIRHDIGGSLSEKFRKEGIKQYLDISSVSVDESLAQ